MLSFFNFSTNPHATDKSGACLRLTEIEREGRGSYQIQRISLKDPIDTPNGGYNYEICPQRVGGKFCPASLSQKERLYVPPFFLAFPFATCTPARPPVRFPRFLSPRLPFFSSYPFFPMPTKRPSASLRYSKMLTIVFCLLTAYSKAIFVPPASLFSLS